MGNFFGPIFVFVALSAVTTFSGAEDVELAFEDKYAGFFLKSGHSGKTGHGSSSVLVSHDRLAVLHSSSTAMVRASYGPFTAKQTVPSLAVLPVVSLNRSADLFTHFAAGTGTEVSAYLVTREPRRERPVLRVLFHFSQGGPRDVGHPGPVPGRDYQNFCAILVAVNEGRKKVAVCSVKPQEATCLAEMTLPYSWWPNEVVSTENQKAPKGQKVTLSVEYAVAVGVKGAECTEDYVNDNMPTPMTTTPLWQLPLSSEVPILKEIPSPDNSSIRMLVPETPLYPGSRLYVTTVARRNVRHLLNIFVVRARVKNGLRIIGVESASSHGWFLNVDMNPRKNSALVTAFRQTNTLEVPADEKVDDDGFIEVLRWLLEVDKNVEAQGTAHIVWALRKVPQTASPSEKSVHHPHPQHVTGGDVKAKVVAELRIEKDDIQSVLLISKTWELVNTAVLNGKQVSQPMKAYIVSHAGKVADVTLQAACSSADESILKVSPSCTSVYLDGSEIRGSHNASVTVTYEKYVGHARFTVWIPEVPLDVHMEDTKLSQIRYWRAPKELPKKLTPRTREEIFNRRPRGQGKMPKQTSNPGAVIGGNGNADGHVACRLRYQQTPVEVYTRFFAVDDNSGRESYLLSRKAVFRVTELVEDNLNVVDSRIVALKGRIVQGLSVGKTEVQILSPITGLVIGYREVKVGKDKETITGLKVTVVTGLQLSLRPTYELTRSYVAETSVTHQLTAQYQEGLLDVEVQFADGVATPLSEMAEDDFRLDVHSLDEGVIAMAPATSPLRPRVIAVGPGSGNLLHLSLQLVDGCRRSGAKPLATTIAAVSVLVPRGKERGGDEGSEQSTQRSHGQSTQRSEIQNDFLAENPDGIKRFSGEAGPSKESTRRPQPSVQAQQQHPFDLAEMSFLEIGMYATVGVVCFAIAIFVVSCAVYAVRFHKKRVDNGGFGDSVANAHDWVWLGRATLERSSAGASRKCPTPSSTPRLRPAVEQHGHRGASILRKLARSGNIEGASGSERSSSERECGVAQGVGTGNGPPVQERVVHGHRKVWPRRRNDAGSDGSETPPPVPPHGRPSSPQGGPSAKDKRKLRAARELTWNARAGMNYDQLMEYFGNLKESNA